MAKHQPPKKQAGIRYSHPGHEEFNRHLEARQNPQGPSNWIDRPWLPPTRHSPMPPLRREFDMNRDPFIARQMEDLSKSEKQRRDEQSGGLAGRSSEMVKKDKPVLANRPPQDMREPTDRQRFAGEWLKEQKDAVMARAALDQSKRDQPGRDPDLDHKYYPKGPSQ